MVASKAIVQSAIHHCSKAAEMDEAFVKLSRKITEWEWYTDANTFRVFVHLLLAVNWKQGRFRGVDIPAGSVPSSYSKISQQLEISVQSVRTAIAHLESTGELTSKGFNKFSIFQVVKWREYQSANKQTTNEQQTNNKRLTTIEEGKKGRKKEKDNTAETAKAVIDHLNSVSGKSFRYGDANIRPIKARLNDGFSFDDFKKVIESKNAEWSGDKNMSVYIRPETLFGSKFDGYVQATGNSAGQIDYFADCK